MVSILFVLENYYPHVGGVETLFASLAEGLVHAGHSATVLTHQMRGTKKHEIINGVRIHRVFCFYSRYFFTFFAFFAALRLARPADIIHTTTYNGAPPAWAAARLLGKPVIITVHEVLGKKWRKFLSLSRLSALFHQFFELLILSLGYDYHAAVSHSTLRALHRLVPRLRSSVVYNGIDYHFWKPHHREAQHIRTKLELHGYFVGLFYGRPGISKGLDILIRSLPSLVRRIPTFRLLAIVSTDPAYAAQARAIRALAARLHVSRFIQFLRPVPRELLPHYLSAADCVIVPSLSEGFGLGVAEACSVRRVVVASNVDSIPEVISGPHILFDVGNPSALADAVIRAYTGKITKRPLLRFPFKETIQNYLNIYFTLLSHAR